MAFGKAKMSQKLPRKRVLKRTLFYKRSLIDGVILDNSMHLGCFKLCVMYSNFKNLELIAQKPEKM